MKEMYSTWISVKQCFADVRQLSMHRCSSSYIYISPVFRCVGTKHLLSDAMLEM